MNFLWILILLVVAVVFVLMKPFKTSAKYLEQEADFYANCSNLANLLGFVEPPGEWGYSSLEEEIKDFGLSEDDASDIIAEARYLLSKPEVPYYGIMVTLNDCQVTSSEKARVYLTNLIRYIEEALEADRLKLEAMQRQEREDQ